MVDGEYLFCDIFGVRFLNLTRTAQLPRLLAAPGRRL